ncbi:hypothetical protein I3843_14G090700 [Carya illinoinensis]|uniref:Uncharacterized protein n=1 Tax=Carya illinoinensis TaxID=32201 RepID=A0A922AKR5_CARIL|nr:hypothetical protein I3842_14G092000 [Carya illinoinensis]KAG7947358.1 hypothetical protein I3843_14G090700 [Carya illinoinensis]
MSGGSWAAALGFLNKATDCCHRCASSPLPPLEFGFMQIYDQLISKLYILQQKCHVDKCTMLIKSGKNGVHISCILVQHDLISLISLPFGTFNIMIDQVVILRKARGLCRRLPVVDPKNWMLKTRQAGTFCRLIRMRSLVVF